MGSLSHFFLQCTLAIIKIPKYFSKGVKLSKKFSFRKNLHILALNKFGELNCGQHCIIFGIPVVRLTKIKKIPSSHPQNVTFVSNGELLSINVEHYIRQGVHCIAVDDVLHMLPYSPRFIS